MARTSTPISLLDTVLASGTSGTKGNPGAITTNGFYDNQANYDSPLGIYIKNDIVAPGVPLTVVIQVSDDSILWTDEYAVSGSTSPYNSDSLAGVVTRSIVLGKVRFVRAIAYGNTARGVEVRVRLHAVTGL